jgi:hypothetical protein
MDRDGYGIDRGSIEKREVGLLKRSMNQFQSQHEQKVSESIEDE